MTAEEWARVRPRVEAERLRRSLRQSDLGPQASVTDLLTARDRWTIPVVASRVEQALDWAPGSILAIARGGEPTPRRTPGLSDLRRARDILRRIDIIDPAERDQLCAEIDAAIHVLQTTGHVGHRGTA